MFFQMMLKDIAGMSRQDADGAFRAGIVCNWWRKQTQIKPHEVIDRLTPRNLRWHLDHYDTPDPLEHDEPFGDHSPFISVTAGVVERDAYRQRNFVYDPLFTAVQFATRDFTTTGYVFRAYVFTLGRPSLELSDFAEEVRELNIYAGFRQYYREGEITAKVEIRGPQIERWEEYDGAALRNAGHGVPLAPLSTRNSPGYAPPERFCNIRGLVTV